MSTRWPGGLIKPIAPLPSGANIDSIASGLWTLDQQAYWRSQNLWPDPNQNPSAFIENLFQTWLYTGNGSTQTIANGVDLAGKGGLTWIKSRSSGAEYHNLFDTVRGAADVLFSNVNDAAANSPTRLTSFNSNGFTVGSNSGTNANAATYVGWTFREQPKFFDVVTFSGNSVNGRTIAHNLGSAPGMIIIKNVTFGSQNWAVWHRSLSPTFYAILNSGSTAINDSTIFTATAPTSSVFSVGTSPNTNQTGSNYIAYLFAHNAGGFGLSGNDNVISCGSVDKNFSIPAAVNLGYEPQYVMLKYLNSAQDWQVYDVMRGFSETNDAKLAPNTTAAETSETVVNPTSTGFTITSSPGGSYIYMAIRRPMKVPTDATTVFSPLTSSATTGTTLNTGFVVDAQLVKTRTVTFSTSAVDRLRGNSSTTTDSGATLYTATTQAELAQSSSQRWSNTGFNIPGNYGDISCSYYSFARRPGFMDVVCYTGTGSATTQAHNLGAVPEMMIFKVRSTTDSWQVYCSALSVSGGSYLLLNDTAVAQTNGSTRFTGAPTSTQINLSTNGSVNGSGSTYIAYLFATLAGVSKVGSYTGTGTTSIINCGFTAGARFVLIKRTDSTGDWYVWDSARGIVAGNDPYLLLNSTAAEVTNTDFVDTAATGFEISSTAPAAINASGGSYIFLAIA